MKKIWHDKETDILNIELQDGVYWKSIELSNGMVVDVDKSGNMLGIEILKASSVFENEARIVLEHVDEKKETA